MHSANQGVGVGVLARSHQIELAASSVAEVLIGQARRAVTNSELRDEVERLKTKVLHEQVLQRQGDLRNRSLEGDLAQKTRTIDIMLVRIGQQDGLIRELELKLTASQAWIDIQAREIHEQEALVTNLRQQSERSDQGHVEIMRVGSDWRWFRPLTWPIFQGLRMREIARRCQNA